MSYILLAFFVAALLTYLAIPVIINVAITKKLVDVPEGRKQHLKAIPSLGGIGIFGGFLIATLLVWPNQLGSAQSLYNLQYITAACLIIFFLGLKDDIVVISPLKKFIGQLIAAWIIVYKCKLQITSFQGVFGVNYIPNALSLGVTYLAIVLITNAFNLIDGVDGLSGHLSLICFVCFAAYFYNSGIANIGYAVIAAAMAGAICAFLVFNHHPAQIFMGDTGSLLIGLINAMLLIKFISLTMPVDATVITNASVNITTKTAWLKGPVLGLSFLAIPLFDTIRVFGLRILSGKSPFSPDRKHIHHILLDKKLTPPTVTLILTISALVLILITHIANYYCNYTVALVILLCSCMAMFAIAYKAPQRSHLYESKKRDGETASRIVNIARNAVRAL